jgi:hypothetical protein
MLPFLHRLLHLPPPIPHDRALAIARAECDARGWPWVDPIHVSQSPFAFHVMTNAQCRGGNVYIRIRRSDGHVLRAAFARH